MAELLALEVMEGPMDGLKLVLADPGDKVEIGRQVGNAMALAVDKSVSRRHARAAVEGRDWCMEDRNSTGGIWVSGTKSRKFALERGQVILLGSTILEVFTPDHFGVDVRIDDTCFKDPRSVYRLSPRVKDAWDRLYQEAESSHYCTVTGLLRELYTVNNGSENHPCLEALASGESWKCLGDWLAEARVKPFYNLGDEVLVSPRLWHIMDMAGNANSRVIDSKHLLRAVLDEGRSVPARLIKKDRGFLEARGLIPPSDKGVPEAPPKPPEESPVIKKTGARPARKPGEGPFLLVRMERFERIILGFGEDAASSGLTKKDFRLPGMDSTLGEVWEKGDEAAVLEYCERLEEYLICLLAAHREAVKAFEEEIAGRIKETLDTRSRNYIGKFLVREAVEEIAVSVTAVLKEAELEGLSDEIVRECVVKTTAIHKEDHDE